MSKKEDVRYILKHEPSEFYVQSVGSDVTYTPNRNKARLWQPNTKADEVSWHDLVDTGEYSVVKRTETVEVNYEEVSIEWQNN